MSRIEQIDELLNHVVIDDWGQNLARWALAQAIEQFYTFLLVVVRFSGLALVGPLLGNSLLPTQVRILAVISLAFLVTPTLRDHRLGFDLLDLDHDGRISADELPEILKERLPPVQQVRFERDGLLTRAQYWQSFRAPESLGQLGLSVLGELALGMSLGFGVSFILSGLQLAGQVIDRQAGLEMASLFNPELNQETSIAGQSLHLLGTVALLTLEPFGGMSQMIRILRESFCTIPPGQGLVSTGLVNLLSELIHQSMKLGVGVAAPLVILMTLVEVSMGILSRSVPQINIQSVGTTARAIIGVLLIGITFGGGIELLIDQAPGLLTQLRDAMIYPQGEVLIGP